VNVYPRLPVPKGRESDPGIRRKNPRFDKLLMGILAGAVVAGFALGFVARPIVSSGDDKLQEKLAESDKSATALKQRADDATRNLNAVTEEKQAIAKKLSIAETAQTQLATKAAEAEKKAKEADALQTKLKEAVDKSGSVSTENGEVRIQLVDKVLFKLGDDQLTGSGKAVLAKVASALKDLPDKQVWVQGHTDDTPIVQPPMPKVKQPPVKRGQKPPPLPPAPPVKFATNWELSSARALTVVHYLQDVSKLEPSRLAALAFGQYRPVSKSKSLNRRIEIVLYPKHGLK